MRHDVRMGAEGGAILAESALIACSVSLAIGFCAQIVSVPLLRRAGLVDVPNARSSHDDTALRGGGLAVTVGVTAGIILSTALDPGISSARMVPIILMLLFVVALGWTEDISELSAYLRLAGQFAIGAFCAAVGGLLADNLVAPWVVLGGVATVGLVNVVNFMDGLNGMSVFHAAVFGSAFVVDGLVFDRGWMCVAGAAVVGGYLAFLPWNASGRVFLGDSGSYLLGGVCALTILLGWMGGLPLVALAAPFLVYVADTGVTLILRIARGETWSEAHRDHVYQRLHQHGMPHLAVSGIVALASALCAVLGVVAATTEGVTAIMCWIGLLAIPSTYVGLGPHR